MLRRSIRNNYSATSSLLMLRCGRSRAQLQQVGLRSTHHSLEPFSPPFTSQSRLSGCILRPHFSHINNDMPIASLCTRAQLRQFSSHNAPLLMMSSAAAAAIPTTESASSPTSSPSSSSSAPPPPHSEKCKKIAHHHHHGNDDEGRQQQQQQQHTWANSALPPIPPQWQLVLEQHKQLHKFNSNKWITRAQGQIVTGTTITTGTAADGKTSLNTLAAATTAGTEDNIAGTSVTSKTFINKSRIYVQSDPREVGSGAVMHNHHDNSGMGGIGGALGSVVGSSSSSSPHHHANFNPLSSVGVTVPLKGLLQQHDEQKNGASSSLPSPTSPSYAWGQHPVIFINDLPPIVQGNLWRHHPLTAGHLKLHRAWVLDFTTADDCEAEVGVIKGGGGGGGENGSDDGGHRDDDSRNDIVGKDRRRDAYSVEDIVKRYTPDPVTRKCNPIGRCSIATSPLHLLDNGHTPCSEANKEGSDGAATSATSPSLPPSASPDGGGYWSAVPEDESSPSLATSPSIQWRPATDDEFNAAVTYYVATTYATVPVEMLLIKHNGFTDRVRRDSVLTIYNAQETMDPFSLDVTLCHRHGLTGEKLPDAVVSGLTSAYSLRRFKNLNWIPSDEMMRATNWRPLRNETPIMVQKEATVRLIHLSQLPCEELQHKLRRRLPSHFIGKSHVPIVRWGFDVWKFEKLLTSQLERLFKRAADVLQLREQQQAEKQRLGGGGGGKQQQRKGRGPNGSFGAAQLKARQDRKNAVVFLQQQQLNVSGEADQSRGEDVNTPLMLPTFTPTSTPESIWINVDHIYDIFTAKEVNAHAALSLLAGTKESKKAAKNDATPSPSDSPPSLSSSSVAARPPPIVPFVYSYMSTVEYYNLEQLGYAPSA